MSSTSTMTAWSCLVASLVFGTIADVTGKRWAMRDSGWDLMWCCVFYSLSTLVWLPIIRYRGLIVSTSIWGATSTMVGVLIAVHYGEEMTPRRVVGLCCGLACIWLMSD